MRQTNAVWIMFIVGTLMLEELQQLQIFRDDSFSITGFIGFIKAIWCEKMHLIRITLPLLIPVLGFIVFLIKNGGIVLGKTSLPSHSNIKP
jgi:hypothetical protein